jgi:hypothetical protein
MKNSQLFFSLLVTSFFSINMPSLNASTQTVDDWVEKALGNYQSQIWSGGSLLSGITEFKKNSDGSLDGRYTMNEEQGTVPGGLSQCQAQQLRVLRCVWNDKYGTGNLEFTFSEDFASFNGYWGQGEPDSSLQWNGSR